MIEGDGDGSIVVEKRDGLAEEESLAIRCRDHLHGHALGRKRVFRRPVRLERRRGRERVGRRGDGVVASRVNRRVNDRIELRLGLAEWRRERIRAAGRARFVAEHSSRVIAGPGGLGASLVRFAGLIGLAGWLVAEPAGRREPERQQPGTRQRRERRNGRSIVGQRRRLGGRPGGLADERAAVVERECRVERGRERRGRSRGRRFGFVRAVVHEPLQRADQFALVIAVRRPGRRRRRIRVVVGSIGRWRAGVREQGTSTEGVCYGSRPVWI